MNKQDLLKLGVSRMAAFCDINELPVPPVNVHSRDSWPYGACAYYRPTKIEICVDACAVIGRAGRSWSYPGYSVDRTPFGVVQHELGHHVDIVKSGRKTGYMGEYSISMRSEVLEAPLTSYCPNDAEWFAEMFRLFVTNPDLLMRLRPKTWQHLRNDFQPVETRTWGEVLQFAPERTITACKRKLFGYAKA